MTTIHYTNGAVRIRRGSPILDLRNATDDQYQRACTTAPGLDGEFKGQFPGFRFPAEQTAAVLTLARELWGDPTATEGHDDDGPVTIAERPAADVPTGDAYPLSDDAKKALAPAGPTAQPERVNILDIRKGDLFTTNGVNHHIAITDAKRWGPQGEAHHTVIVNCVDISYAAMRDDDVYELGFAPVHGARIPDDTEAILIRRDLPHHHVEDDPRTDDLSEAERQVSRAELLRMTLKRREQEREYGDADTRWRRLIQQALADEVPVAEIVQTTGLSRARVYQIRDGRR